MFDMVYEGSFSSWKNVIEEFNGCYDDEEAKQKVAELYPEPDIVLYANYGGGSYDGDAIVVWYDKGKFYTNEGGHCSCYGLEDQWSPEEYEPDIFLAVLDRKIESASDEGGDYPSSDKLVWRLIKKRAEFIINNLAKLENEQSSNALQLGMDEK